MLLSYQAVGTTNFRHEVYQLRSIRLICLDDTFQESHATEQNSMTLLLEATRDFGQELRDILGDALNDFDRCEDSFLSDIGRTVANTLSGRNITFRTSRWRSLASSAVQISLRTHRTRPTMLLLLLLRSMRIRLVAIISSSDF